MEATGSKIHWRWTLPDLNQRSFHPRDVTRIPASSGAGSAASPSLSRDSSTGTWSATVTSRDISAPSVGKVLTTLSTWRDTRELTQVRSLEQIDVIKDEANSVIISGVRPYKCNLCEKSFTQRCSLESHCLKVHGVAHQYDYKQRRSKVNYDLICGFGPPLTLIIQMYVCEDCGHTTPEPEVHYLHLKENHPYSPALLKFYDKRHFKFNNSNFASVLLQCSS